MPYALFVYDHHDRLARLPEPERQSVVHEYEALLATPGVAGYRLKPPDAATTLRTVDGEQHVEAGPVVSGPMPLAGFYLLDTGDDREALAFAARIPAARLGGTVSVYPLADDPPPRPGHMPSAMRSVSATDGV
jgi:hypothetical protein